METCTGVGWMFFFLKYFVFSELSQHCFKRKSAVEISGEFGDQKVVSESMELGSVV